MRLDQDKHRLHGIQARLGCMQTAGPPLRLWDETDAHGRSTLRTKPIPDALRLVAEQDPRIDLDRLAGINNAATFIDLHGNVPNDHYGHCYY